MRKHAYDFFEIVLESTDIVSFIIDFVLNWDISCQSIGNSELSPKWDISESQIKVLPYSVDTVIRNIMQPIYSQ